MKIHRVAIIGPLLSLSTLSSLAFGQTDTNACQEGDIGVINGTFDCPTSPGDRGWQYAAQLNAQTDGFLAEITSASERSSNVLKIHKIYTDPTDVQPFLPREMVWQDNITIGDQPAYQLVLRFDHFITQRIAYEDSFRAEFEINGVTSSDINFERVATLEVTSAATNDDNQCKGWLTSEVFIDIPGGITSTITTCSINFKVKQLLCGGEGSTPGECTNIEAIYPDVMLDNVEIRVITSECEIQPLDDGQPLDCDLFDCGGAGTQQEPDYIPTAVVPVAGPDQQDPRNFKVRCPDEIECCPIEFSFTPRFSANTNCESYERSPSESLTCSSIADLNFDDQVDGSDLTVLLGQWGLKGECLSADLNGDGQVDGADLAILLGEWGRCG